MYLSFKCNNAFRSGHAPSSPGSPVWSCEHDAASRKETQSSSLSSCQNRGRHHVQTVGLEGAVPAGPVALAAPRCLSGPPRQVLSHWADGGSGWSRRSGERRWPPDPGLSCVRLSQLLCPRPHLGQHLPGRSGGLRGCVF